TLETLAGQRVCACRICRQPLLPISAAILLHPVPRRQTSALASLSAHPPTSTASHHHTCAGQPLLRCGRGGRDGCPLDNLPTPLCEPSKSHQRISRNRCVGRLLVDD